MLIILCVSFHAQAQTTSVGAPGWEDYYRRLQLKGNLDPAVSFTVRPLSPSRNRSHDTLARQAGTGEDLLSPFFKDKDQLSILPLAWQQQYAANPFYNWNNGAIIPAKGYQTLLSGGVFAKYGILSLQLRPEILFAENRSFPEVLSHYGAADLPSRFGSSTYSKVLWGQSSIRLTVDPVSIGLSNENLSWGPGIRNSLLMSNNAAGFKHLTLNTTRPVKTPIGSFEAQVIAARLDSSGFTAGLPNDWRYLSGLVFSYQPKWVPGLFLGLTRSFQIYSKDMDGSFGDIFPFFQAFQKFKTNEDARRRDQLASLFARWVLPAARAEVYFEYGLNDHSYNTRDFLMSPEHSRAYLLGMKKLMPYKQRKDEFIQIAAEITRMQQSIDRTVRDAGEWYMHSQVLHGYTHRGEVLGAGIGPGGNFQSLNVGWVKGLKTLGVQLERFEHNGDLADVYNYTPWIDFSVGAVADWTCSRFQFHAKIQGIQSVNYQWKDGINGRPKENIFNINAQLGILYSF